MVLVWCLLGLFWMRGSDSSLISGSRQAWKGSRLLGCNNIRASRAVAAVAAVFSYEIGVQLLHQLYVFCQCN
jgi:hypothetical protein